MEVVSGVWAFTNASSTNNTNDSTFSGNWYNTGVTNVATGSPHNNVLSGNVQVGGTWPTAAQQVMAQTGIEAAVRPGTGDLHALGSGRCLDVPGAVTTLGTQPRIWSCAGGPSQLWTRTASGQLTVFGGGDTRCLDASGRGTANGTAVVVWTCNGQDNQQWHVNANGTITSAQSGLCLDVNGASTANGATVQLWTCQGGANQQWALA
jgi:ricin-type beta-trefoil lectin protein